MDLVLVALGLAVAALDLVLVALDLVLVALDLVVVILLSSFSSTSFCAPWNFSQALTHRLVSEQALAICWQSAAEPIAMFSAISESGVPRRLIGFRREDRVFGVGQSVRKIERVVQAATLLSLQSTVDNQFCNHC